MDWDYTSSAKRKRMFFRAVRHYNNLNTTNIDATEAWNAFKGLLGRCLLDNMIEVIGRVYANPRVIRDLMELAQDDLNGRVAILREEARRTMRIYRIERFPPPPPRHAPEPFVAPPPQPPAAAAVAVVAAPIGMVAYDFLRAMIELTGKVGTREIELASDELTPAQVDSLFALMREWGECPICMERVPRRSRWTFCCDHQCCAKCMLDFVHDALANSNFPVMCPGRCGNAVDPRRVQEMSAVCRGGATCVPENIVRFISMQLASTHTVPAETAGETHVCPTCRAVVVGRPNAGSAMARCTNPFCAQRFCTNCKTPWHDGRGCEDQMKMDVESDAIISATTKQCPRCGRRASHFRFHACHHLRCPCGFEYCYECMGPWSEHAVGRSREGCRIFCHDGCHCVLCDECKPGKPCKVCVSGCPRCKLTTV